MYITYSKLPIKWQSFSPKFSLEFSPKLIDALEKYDVNMT